MRAASFFALTMRSLPVCAALMTSILALSPDARANGRFPQSNAVFFSPSDPGVVLLRTTFGLMTSHDRGATWDWVCEQSVGLAGIEDPMYAVTPDGTVLGSTYQGLSVSHDQACSWAFAGGDLASHVFIDLAARPSTPGTVMAFASSYAGAEPDGGALFYQSLLFETKDQGKTFAAIGPALDPSLLGETVDVTASDPDRVYVSAVRDAGPGAQGVLLTSTDHGKTFAEAALPLLKPAGAPETGVFIAGVDPLNADRLYVRTYSAVDKPARLLVSDDAGKTFKTIFTGTSALAGFALSEDGKKVWVGSVTDGLNVASTSDFAFTQVSKIEIDCLKIASDGLWACSSERSGFVAGLSKDDGATFEPKLHFCDIRGPLACAPGTSTHTQCSLGGTLLGAAPPWPLVRANLGCDGASSPDAGAPPDAGGDDDGGGCALRGPSSTPIAALVASVIAAIAIALRRRRRRR